jgi:hypothetical protein
MNDEMEQEYSFKGAERGKFYRPDAKAALPIYLREDLQAYLLDIAQRKGTTLGELVNDLLAKEIAIVEAVK